MLIKRVYDADPLECSKCGGTMKVISFIDSRQADVIERIMKHCGLWHLSAPRPPPPAGDFPRTTTLHPL